MKEIMLILMCISNYVYGQVSNNWATLNTLKNNNQLIPNTIYIINNLANIELVAKTSGSFYERPFKRTFYALDYDDETFDFNTKVITGYDNISCVLKCVNGVWSILNDAGHKPYKVTTVTDNVILNYTKTYDKVIAFNTVIDEVYSKSNLNITCGANVGLSYSIIEFHKTTIINGNIIKSFATPLELSIPWSNIFITGRFAKFIQL